MCYLLSLKNKQIVSKKDLWQSLSKHISKKRAATYQESYTLESRYRVFMDKSFKPGSHLWD